MTAWQTSNPALTDMDTFREAYGHMQGTRQATATYSGVINKTALLVTGAVGAGFLAYEFLPFTGSVLLISNIASLIVTFGVFWAIRKNPKVSPALAWVYVAAEGVFLGLLTKLLDSVLASTGTFQTLVADAQSAGSSARLALPAFVVTMGVTLAMLGLYVTRILKPTQRMASVIGTMVAGCSLVYLIAFVMGLFGIEMPFLSLGSALQGGWPALLGLGISLLFLVVASLVLVMDFARIEEIVTSGQPKYMEWYAGFALCVTLAWVYYEALKLVFRLYIIFGSRD
jgi:uncharacterized YccA/Bax inhibitor family protein